MLRQAQHEDSKGLHPELVEGYNAKNIGWCTYLFKTLFQR
jgi:hypothetical protein